MSSDQFGFMVLNPSWM